MELPDDIEFSEQDFAAGQVLITEGEPDHRMLILVDGVVEVLKTGEQLCQVREPGALFGEISALLGGVRTATVRTVTPCKFRVLEDCRPFVQRLQRDPQATAKVLKTLAQRVSVMDSQYADLIGKLDGRELPARRFYCVDW